MAESNGTAILATVLLAIVLSAGFAVFTLSRGSSSTIHPCSLFPSNLASIPTLTITTRT